MNTFTPKEARLVQELKGLPPHTVLKVAKPCPLHSSCSPLPLFRVYKIDDGMFEAEWNDYHNIGTKQIFRFDEVNGNL